eukprot:scaffold87390_cov23-Cyclotella_meneghiniana.AAC.1
MSAIFDHETCKNHEASKTNLFNPAICIVNFARYRSVSAGGCVDDGAQLHVNLPPTRTIWAFFESL